MKKERLEQEIQEIEKVELLEDFKVEELEQRFEMGWFRNGMEVKAEPATGEANIPNREGSMDQVRWYGGSVTARF